jgi:hypothetical protein
MKFDKLKANEILTFSAEIWALIKGAKYSLSNEHGVSEKHFGEKKEQN